MRRVALLSFSLAFLSTLAVLAAAAELGLSVSSVFDWFYNVTVRLGFKAQPAPIVAWDYALMGSSGGKAVAADGFSLAYNLSVDVNTTAASPDTVVEVAASTPTVSVYGAEPRQLFVVYANGTMSALGGGGGQQVCASPRECGLELGWGRVYYTDAMGNPASPAAGKQVLIHFPIHASPQGRYGKALVLVEVHRYDPSYGTVIIDENMAIGVSWALVGDGIEVTLLWWPKDPGTYLIRAYVWNGFPGQVEEWESYIEPLELVVNIP
ncbi:hypothetical protein Pyrde_1910 [Pyrodictium delaneyi]|uniref:Uncharacterized protein n=1 Tax=Pyrodictium delaneyi TaxID=1273541 RepID=A0A0N7JDE3_9CREN|nr:hypothetical protein [Pyrodictium delaneyi]ALL01953.1 hypothetical protein Pyrde_1910 [Pyrodictium delaneyi]